MGFGFVGTSDAFGWLFSVVEMLCSGFLSSLQYHMLDTTERQKSSLRAYWRVLQAMDTFTYKVASDSHAHNEDKYNCNG